MSPLEAYFEALPPAHRERMLVARDFLRGAPYRFEERYKWSIPVYYAGDRYVCYLNYGPKEGRSYLGFGRAADLDHPSLLAEGRKQVRILVLDDHAPLKDVAEVLAQLGYG